MKTTLIIITSLIYIGLVGCGSEENEPVSWKELPQPVEIIIDPKGFGTVSEELRPWLRAYSGGYTSSALLFTDCNYAYMADLELLQGEVIPVIGRGIDRCDEWFVIEVGGSSYWLHRLVVALGDTNGVFR